MKNHYILAATGILIFVVGIGMYAHTRGSVLGYRPSSSGMMGYRDAKRTNERDGYRRVTPDVPFGGRMSGMMAAIDTSPLSEVEIKGLLKMREEEKLARDVYQALAEKWNVPVFQNIMVSEERHSEAVQSSMAAHGVSDPVTDDTRGVFTSEDFTKLYSELVTRGSESLREAYQVGAYIEELDIVDLEQEIKNTTHSDIRYMYEALKRGSENHLRAFNQNILTATGEEYTPVLLSKDAFTIIRKDTTHGGGRGMMGGKWNDTYDPAERDGGRGHGMMGRW